jgi:hypothetical protein
MLSGALAVLGIFQHFSAVFSGVTLESCGTGAASEWAKKP